MFGVAKGQILNQNLAIWSHWLLVPFEIGGTKIDSLSLLRNRLFDSYPLPILTSFKYFVKIRLSIHLNIAHLRSLFRFFWLPAITTFGSGCGSVGRAVASNTRGMQFESSHWQKFIYIEHFVYCQLCIRKTKIKKKRPGMAHFLTNAAFPASVNF